MLKVLSVEQMRRVDELTTYRYGIPSLLLMENAGKSVVEAIKARFNDQIRDKRFLVLCGRGNNGGDGAVVARILWMQGAKVKVFLFGRVEDAKGDAAVNFNILRRLNGSEAPLFGSVLKFHEASSVNNVLDELEKSDVVIDSLFGTGISRPIEGDLANLLLSLKDWKSENTGARVVVSADMPSGLNADESAPIGPAVSADMTITFTAPKLACVYPPCSNLCGELHVANIGTPASLIQSVDSRIFVAEKRDVQEWIRETEVTPDSYKKKRGRVLIIAGSENYVGASALAANACFESGAGMVTLAVPRAIRDAVSSRLLNEVILRNIEDRDIFSGEFDLVAIGCGLAAGLQTQELVKQIMERRRAPVLLDAEALNAISPFDLKGDDEMPLILTPHIGEFKRLIGRDVRDRISDASEFAVKHRVLLVLKGERNLIAKPDGTIVINPTGDAGVSRAGAGDTLTGILSAFIAQTLSTKGKGIDNIFEALLAGLYIAGRAAQIAAQRTLRRFLLPSEVTKYFVDASKEFEVR